MRYAALSLACALTVACAEPATDESEATTCSVTVMSTVPENENQKVQDVYHRSTLAFHLSSPDATASVVVDGADGKRQDLHRRHPCRGPRPAEPPELAEN